MKKAPDWATELLNQVLTEQGFKNKVLLNWRESKTHIQTSGHAHYPVRGKFYYVRWSGGKIKETKVKNTHRYSISITAGSDTNDQKQTLLHEIAHILTRGHHHDPIFYRKVWELYNKYGIDSEMALKRESWYRKQMKVQYERLQGNH